VQLLPTSIALLDDLPDRQNLIAWNLSLFVGLRERLLHLAFLGTGNFRCDRMWDHPSFHSRDKLFLTSFEEHTNGCHVSTEKSTFFAISA
jgi:hypothetical protein